MANNGISPVAIVLLIVFVIIILVGSGGVFLFYELDKKFHEADGACVTKKNSNCYCDVFTPEDECKSEGGTFHPNKDCTGLCPN